jgi:uncharacterized protein (TIGR03437 family)
MKAKNSVFFLLFMEGFSQCSGLALAQSLPSLVGAGYQIPNATSYSPGQVITLFVRGLGLSGPAFASSASLPTTLAGISVSVTDQTNGVTDFSGDLPLFSVVPLSCDGIRCTGPDLNAITVQMPTEIPQCAPSGFNPCFAPIPHPTAIVNKNGQPLAQLQFVQLTQNLHLLNACDTILNQVNTIECIPLVTHANGSLVGLGSPARQGETIVVYATGVAQSGPRGIPAPTTGTPEVVGSFQVGFDFRTDISSTSTSSAQPNTGVHPVYAGQVGGLVGIHQINITLPTSFPTTLGSCGAGTNMGLNIGVGNSFDGVRLCVSP